jgi:hypothetical protein
MKDKLKNKLEEIKKYDWQEYNALAKIFGVTGKICHIYFNSILSVEVS